MFPEPELAEIVRIGAPSGGIPKWSIWATPLPEIARSHTVTSPCSQWQHRYRTTSTKVTLHYNSPITNNKVTEGDACTTHLIGIAAPLPTSEKTAAEDWAFDVVSVKYTDVRVSTHTPGQSRVASAVSSAAAKAEANQKSSAGVAITDSN